MTALIRLSQLQILEGYSEPYLYYWSFDSHNILQWYQLLLVQEAHCSWPRGKEGTSSLFLVTLKSHIWLALNWDFGSSKQWHTTEHGIGFRTAYWSATICLSTTYLIWCQILLVSSRATTSMRYSRTEDCYSLLRIREAPHSHARVLEIGTSIKICLRSAVSIMRNDKAGQRAGTASALASFTSFPRPSTVGSSFTMENTQQRCC